MTSRRDSEDCIDVVIEIPRGSRNKYEYRPRQRPHLPRPPAVLRHRSIPPTTASSPTRSARTAIRSTPWCCSRTRRSPAAGSRPGPSACSWMQDEAGPDAKIICVPPSDPRWEHVDGPRRPARASCSTRSSTSSTSTRRSSPGKESSTAGLGGPRGRLARDRGRPAPPPAVAALTALGEFAPLWRANSPDARAPRQTVARRAAPMAPARSPSAAGTRRGRVRWSVAYSRSARCRSHRVQHEVARRRPRRRRARSSRGRAGS